MAAAKGRQGSAEKQTAIPHIRIEDEKQLEEIYKIGGPLGEGSFGVVREVTHLETNKRWACKAINKEKAGSSKITLLEREVQILKKVHHEHIIMLKEVFETAQKMYLVMELCEGGELSKELRRQKSMKEESVKTIMARLSSAIAYLHKNDMVHRDIKLENILLSQNPNERSDNLYLKVTDFGLSVVKGGVGHDNMMMDFCGTPMYMAPEIIDNKTYGQLCDVWAMGIIMYSLLNGSSPFRETSSDEELYEMIKKLNIRQIIESNRQLDSSISTEAKSLLAGMLNIDPAHRYTASEVKNDPWITGKGQNHGPKNVLQMMREWGPNLGKDDEETPSMNGNEESSSSCADKDTRVESSGSSSRDGSANSKKSKSGQHSGGAQRSSVSGLPAAPKTKKLTRNSTDPNLQQTAANASKGLLSSKGSTPLRSTVSKSKSPIDRDTGRAGLSVSRTSNKTQSHHAAKPLATRTSTSQPSSSSNSNTHGRTSENNHKPKKKISR